jgi:hypothetical protein
MNKRRADFNSALTKLAERASRGPDFFGSLLSAFQQQEALTTNELTKFLGMRPHLLSRLALCRRPRLDSPDFAKQIREIARFTETNPDALLAILRQVEALEALAAHNKIVPIAVTGGKPSLEADMGFLAAARDRDPKGNARTRKKTPPYKDKK